MRLISLVVALGLLVGSQPAWGAVGYANGKAFTYPGNEVDLNLQDDWLGAGAAVRLVFVSAINSQAEAALIPLGFLVWGAMRTAKYRPQATKDAIHASLERQALAPVPGTWQEMLN